jgi:hypothetical protein
LTEHDRNSKSKPASKEAGAPGRVIEITPEMIEAGLEARAAWDSRFEETEGLVIQIYEAMERARCASVASVAPPVRNA